MAVTDVRDEGGPTPLCHIVTPVGMLGCGFDETQTADALASFVATDIPAAIILDSGSTDSGPSKLALGVMSCPRSAYVQDLAKLLSLVHTFHVPLIFSSAGGSGSDSHVREMLAVIKEITEQKGNEHYRFKTIALFSEIPRALVHSRLAANAITGCGPCVPPLTPSDIDATPTIVAQMGPEPFLDAMAAHPDFDIIVAGRAHDPAPHIAWASFIHASHQQGAGGANANANANANPKHPSVPRDALLAGGFAHMGQVLECGGLCATPKSRGATATAYADGSFDIAPLDPRARCVPLTVAAHSMYEKSAPDVLNGPGGSVDVRGATYRALRDGRSVRVRGSEFRWGSGSEEAAPYRVKLEGATTVGWRSAFMGRVRDPILVAQLDDLFERVKAYVAGQHRDKDGEWELGFHVYGREDRESGAFIVGEALASSQQLATSVACTARIATNHAPYPGQKATSGNLGFGIGGQNEIELGACPQFSIYHLMDLQPGEERLWPGASKDGCEAAAVPIFTHSVSILGGGEVRQHLRLDMPVRPAQVTTTQNVTRTEEEHTDDKAFRAEGLASCTKLGQLASVLRSKNAGPYEITFDVMFSSESVYRLVRQSGLLSPKTASEALGFPQEDIVWCGFFDPARAFKVTVPRVRDGKKSAAGGFMENDVHGSQHHLGLIDMELPETLREGLAKLEEL
ncbi:caib baif family enzyme [Diplodia corticola]|uniref:Caib baif family enzyme n=1 Tax=Diplodia corticola TaxID=236234 RepID=A0A1J9RVX6_9PEZI|nr:caib baif family enzyme [Diplodia corticola]OJD32527.1 caib baif family enzyme [Diplodia corticola]